MASPLRPDDPEMVGPFRLVGLIEAVAGGVVYSGRDLRGEPVVVAVLTGGPASDPAARDRFRVSVGRAYLRVDGESSPVFAADLAAAQPWAASRRDGRPGAERVLHTALEGVAAATLAAPAKLEPRRRPPPTGPAAQLAPPSPPSPPSAPPLPARPSPPPPSEPAGPDPLALPQRKSRRVAVLTTLLVAVLVGAGTSGAIIGFRRLNAAPTAATGTPRPTLSSPVVGGGSSAGTGPLSSAPPSAPRSAPASPTSAASAFSNDFPTAGPPGPLTGPAFASTDPTNALTLLGLGFAFRLPTTWSCQQLPLPYAGTKWTCVDRRFGRDAPVARITSRPCASPCDATVQAGMRGSFDSPPSASAWVTADPTTTYSQATGLDQNGQRRYFLVLSHFWASQPGGRLDTQIVAQLSGPPGSELVLQKIANEIRLRTD